eukprot:jgi/Chrpa1/4593/Chrysochromulina_OHIO_Genome00004775-RA
MGWTFSRAPHKPPPGCLSVCWASDPDSWTGTWTGVAGQIDVPHDSDSGQEAHLLPNFAWTLLIASLIAFAFLRFRAQVTDLAIPKLTVAAYPLASRRELLEYQLDNFFSSSPYASGLLLCVITACLVLGGGLGLWTAAGYNESLLSSMWTAWRFISDGEGEYGDSIASTVVGVVLVLSGMLFFALLVGLIGESIEAKINSLKQGKGPVLEVGHTLVLNWSSKFTELAREIAKANESAGGGVLVVLSDQYSKEEMDEMVANELSAEEMRGTRVVCRHGDPVSVASLRKVAAQTARAIVFLANERVLPDLSDALAVRAVLALRAGLEHLSGHIVVELRDCDNQPLLDLLSTIDENGMVRDVSNPVLPVVSHDIIGRLMIQCARQPNLAEVYHKLIGFDGMEFYHAPQPALVGQPWRAVLTSFEHAIPVGLLQPREGGGRAALHLNPDDDYILREQDELIVIAEDDDTYTAGPPASFIDPGPPPKWEPPPRGVENWLLCGWRRDLLDMLLELDKYVEAGCVVTVLASVPIEDRTALLEAGKVQRLQLKHIELVHEVGSTIHRSDLECILSSREYTSVLVLANEADESDVQLTGTGATSASDSKNLTTLLLVRDIRRCMAREKAKADAQAQAKSAAMSSPKAMLSPKSMPAAMLPPDASPAQAPASPVMPTAIPPASPAKPAVVIGSPAPDVPVELDTTMPIAMPSASPAKPAVVIGSPAPDVPVELSTFLSNAGLRHLGVFLCTETVASLEAKLDADGRPGFLNFLKEKGISFLKDRQDLVNAVTKAKREKAPAGAPADAPADALAASTPVQVEAPADAPAASTTVQVGVATGRFSPVLRWSHTLGEMPPRIVPKDSLTLLGEIHDANTRDLVVAAGVSAEHIMSSQLLSRVISMVAEDAEVGPLLDTLFAEEGDDLSVRDALFYAAEGENLSFWQVSARARSRGDIAIGYLRGGGEVQLNPPDKNQSLLWTKGDFLVVLGDASTKRDRHIKRERT